MSLKAIRQMAESADGMTIFLNHSYKVPEDVFGVVTHAQAVQRDDVWDLDFDIDVEDENPRALATHKSIQRGVKLGTSIGAIVKDAWKEKDGHVVIDDVTLLEASIVGIPANPRSFVQYAVKALEDAEGTDDREDAEPGFEAGIRTSAIDPTTKGEKVEDHPQPDNATKAREEGDAAVSSPPPAESVDNDTQPDRTTVDVETPQADAQEPEAAQEGDTPTPESAPDGTTKSTAPTKPAIPASDVDSDVVGDEAKALLAMKQDNFTTLLKMVETTTHELVETKKALFEAQKSVKALERERDDANANVELAKQFVQKLSELPIGRRASHSAVISSFNEKFAGIYDPDVIKMLTSGEDTNG